MAGHSKWSNIRHKKEINDKKRSKLFSKLVNNIKASLKYGTDVKQNYKLKNAISQALSNNVSKSVITNILSKFNNACDDIELYAARGMHGSIFIIKCINSNKKKVNLSLKNILNQFNASLISLKAVTHEFDECGEISLLDMYNEHVILTYLSSFVINDFINNILYINLKDMIKLNKVICAMNIETKCSAIMIAKNNLDLKKSILKDFFLLYNKLKEQEHVINIFTNIRNLH